MSQMELFERGAQMDDPHRSGLAALLERLESISPNAHDEAAYALLSELPVETEVRRFAHTVIDAALHAGELTEAGRDAAERARTSLLDRDTRKVQAAALKTAREADRMRGLLRFNPAPEGYTARCAPDHFVLPLLAEHFLARFGEIPWIIIDERRNAALVRERGAPPVLRRVNRERPPAPNLFNESPSPKAGERASWEALWRTYHTAINNEQRANPGLQKQFMPLRYWKYLPEMEGR
jgi:probable DNA metabolism protein